LVPHVIWIKLIKQPENGSFLIWDEKEQRETLNFVDMTTLKNRVKIFHDKRSNRYTMELRNVSMSDQGLYSCVVGNTLGLVGDFLILFCIYKTGSETWVSELQYAIDRVS